MKITKIFLVIALFSFSFACGSDDGENDCVNVAGNWTIEEHCEDSLVGEEINITQNGCNISTVISGATFSGTISGEIDITITNEESQLSAECSGQYASDKVTMDCTPDTCHVVLSR